MSCLNNGIVHITDLCDRIKQVHSGDDLMRQLMMDLVDQVQRNGTPAQQMVIQRCDEHPSKYRVHRDILDDQVGLELFYTLHDVEQWIAGEDNLHVHLQSLCIETLKCLVPPVEIMALISLVPLLVSVLFPHMRHGRGFDKGSYIQHGSTGPGKGDGTQQGWGLFEVWVGDQQQALIVGHDTPRL